MAFQLGGCKNLPWEANDKLSSIDTKGTCVILYEHTGCTGESMEVAPGTGGHSYVGGNFNDKTSSLRAC